MKKIGLFYGGTTAKTAVVALKIQEAFAENEVILIPIEGATREEFESFDNIIAGTSTWFDGELPTYWDEFMPEIESIDMTGKKVALFGLGDQDAIPTISSMGSAFWRKPYQKQCGTDRFHACQRLPFHPITGRQGRTFPGTSPRYRDQSEQTEERILKWVAKLKKEFQ